MEAITKGYSHLFNTVTDAIRELEAVKQQLIQCQQTAELLYIEEDPLLLAQHA